MLAKEIMKTIVNHILTPIFYIFFGLWLVIFHPIQVVTYYVFGRSAQQNVVVVLNILLINSLRILGTRISVNYNSKLPKGRPMIFLANHSSLHDITGLYGLLGKHKLVFVSKKSLAKGIPSVSFNLRKSGAAVIDRKDRNQAVTQILKLGSFINKNNLTAVIFPEGTRRPGLQPFKVGGLNALTKRSPNALIVPIAIQGTGDLYLNRKAYPLNTFQKISWNILDPIEQDNLTNKELIQLAYDQIKAKLE